MTQSKSAILALSFSAAVLAAAEAEALLVLTVDEYTPDILSFTIDGTLDEDTTGWWAGYIAITNDWSNNSGEHTELFDGTPTVDSYSITIDGAATTYFIADGTESYGDSLYFYANSPSVSLTAGTEVSGSVTLTGDDIFDPADVDTLELTSGATWFFDWDSFSLTTDWARLEATAVSAGVPAVPLPPSAAFLAAGLFGLVFGRRRVM